MIANCFCDVASGHIAFFKKFQSKFHPQCPNVFPNAFAFCKLKCFLELVFVKSNAFAKLKNCGNTADVFFNQSLCL